MAVSTGARRTQTSFEAFVREVEPRLRQALVSSYGLVDGRAATVDALSWAWEHWDRLADIDNKPGYLYRVGQSAVRRYSPHPIPMEMLRTVEAGQAVVTPELVPLLAKLPIQQRTVVMLVHAYGWSQAEVSVMLDVSASTVHQHLTRAMSRLRAGLDVHHVC